MSDHRQFRLKSGLAFNAFVAFTIGISNSSCRSSPIIESTSSVNRSADFKSKKPEPEPMPKADEVKKNAWWQEDIFSSKGIDLVKRIEDAKKLLSQKLPSGKDRYPVSGLPLGERHRGLTTLHLATLNLKTNKIETISIVKNGNELPRSTSHEGFNIKLVRTNGVNSDFEIIKPPDYVVLAIKTPVLETASSESDPMKRTKTGKKAKSRPVRDSARRGEAFHLCMDGFGSSRISVSSAVYVPFQPEFARNQELVKKGAMYLQSLAEDALADVITSDIPLLREALKALSPEILFTMLIVERIEPERFIRGHLFNSSPSIQGFKKGLERYRNGADISFSDAELRKLSSGARKVVLTDRQGASYVVRNERGRLYVNSQRNSIESLVFEVLAAVGANGKDSFRYAVSRTGARGIAQLMPETFCGIYDNYGKQAELEKDFFEATRDHLKSVTFQVLQKAESLSRIWKFIDHSSPEGKIIALAASYNYGWPRTLAAMSASSKWAGAYNEPWGANDFDANAQALNNNISHMQVRANALRKQIRATRNSRLRAGWVRELRSLTADIQRKTIVLNRLRKEFKKQHPRFLPDETLKYVREAAAVSRMISEMRQEELFSMHEGKKSAK